MERQEQHFTTHYPVLTNSVNCVRLHVKEFMLNHIIILSTGILCLQIVDGNSKTEVSNQREPGMFCGESEQPQTFISETSSVKVVFHTDNFTDQVSYSVWVVNAIHSMGRI